MLHTKFCVKQPTGSGEEDFSRVFNIYGHGGQLGHVTKILWTRFQCHYTSRLHIKFQLDWPKGFREEDL